MVTEMTLQCIPQMNLLERTSTLDRTKMNIKDHVHRLRTYRHVRYMWVPYTNTVVTVVSNPTPEKILTKGTSGGGVGVGEGEFQGDESASEFGNASGVTASS